MKEKLRPLLLKIRKFRNIESFLIGEDKLLRHLLKLSLIAGVFFWITFMIYSGLNIVLVPYYEAQKLSAEQILLEKELQKVPEIEPELWQQFEKLPQVFPFTIPKIKATFHTLCNLYEVRLKDGQILDNITKDGMSFNPCYLTVCAQTDSQIFAFVLHLTEKLYGVFGLKMLKIHRAQGLNEALSTQIRAGNEGCLVEAKIEFDWLNIKT